MTIEAYAALEAKGALTPFKYEAGPLGPLEVSVRVTHCGVCHSDLGMIDNDFHMSTFPLVPGHEAVGTVSAVGSQVTVVQVGQRVGVGWQCGSCGVCEWCRTGREQLCSSERDTILGHHGGWATEVRTDARFAVPIPEAISSEDAGPLMCAGTTVYSPLLHYGVLPGMRTAVVGVGGLGHLAVQFLAKMGCDVTAISSSHDKDAEARGFGASKVLATRGEELQKAGEVFDFVLSTVGADLDWGSLVSTLRPEGTLCFVGIPAKPMTIHPVALIMREKRVVGGRSGSPTDTEAMLAFAARHGVRPMIEKFPVAEVNAAVDRARAGKVRYRAVLEM